MSEILVLLRSRWRKYLEARYPELQDVSAPQNGRSIQARHVPQVALFCIGTITACITTRHPATSCRNLEPAPSAKTYSSPLPA